MYHYLTVCDMIIFFTNDTNITWTSVICPIDGFLRFHFQRALFKNIIFVMMVTKNWNVGYQLWHCHDVEEKKWHFFSITLSDKFAKNKKNRLCSDISESSRNFSLYKALYLPQFNLLHEITGISMVSVGKLSEKFITWKSLWKVKILMYKPYYSKCNTFGFKCF